MLKLTEKNNQYFYILAGIPRSHTDLKTFPGERDNMFQSVEKERIGNLLRRQLGGPKTSKAQKKVSKKTI